MKNSRRKLAPIAPISILPAAKDLVKQFKSKKMNKARRLPKTMGFGVNVSDKKNVTTTSKKSKKRKTLDLKR